MHGCGNSSIVFTMQRVMQNLCLPCNGTNLKTQSPSSPLLDWEVVVIRFKQVGQPQLLPSSLLLEARHHNLSQQDECLSVLL